MEEREKCYSFILSRTLHETLSMYQINILLICQYYFICLIYVLFFNGIRVRKRKIIFIRQWQYNIKLLIISFNKNTRLSVTFTMINRQTTCIELWFRSCWLLIMIIATINYLITATIRSDIDPCNWLGHSFCSQLNQPLGSNQLRHIPPTTTINVS
jgi:hypothetical protein